MPARIRPSDDPDERRRLLELATEAHQAAVDQNTKDQRAGRFPLFGRGAIDVLARRVRTARADLEELGENEPA